MHLRIAATVAIGVMVAGWSSHHRPYMSFTAFPYDISQQALDDTYDFIAETLDLPELGIFQEGRQEWQAAYVQQLMAELGRLEAEFVVWFVPRDHDLLNETLQQLGVPLGPAFLIWRDTGLLDGNGNARPGLRIWKNRGMMIRRPIRRQRP